MVADHCLGPGLYPGIDDRAGPHDNAGANLGVRPGAGVELADGVTLLGLAHDRVLLDLGVLANAGASADQRVRAHPRARADLDAAYRPFGVGRCEDRGRVNGYLFAEHDPLTLAEARRAVATVLRRTGRPEQARDLLLSAASAIEPGHRPTPGQLSMYRTLLEVAAYTAAVDGTRHAAAEYIGEATATAARLGSDANYRFTAFGPSGVILYQVSVAQVLGDSGTAIQYARRLHPAVITTAERQGRYWVDVARAYHQWGKPEPCYRALLSAERAAPAEVSYRPPVHRMTKELLRADRRRSLPGLRVFAHRIGVPDA